ncbi:MAG: hypothetical protein DCF19_07300 [Pseudanabaena frigida]|uniref:Uncharacterized protein n=1 Tax=Pseudanabaena frigida TaxID=945775 RepID=A0A2W4WGS1_9CYAN|nr:MAG: hypothetical protein DCF19_07300 [Pseudanabaena frigida]
MESPKINCTNHLLTVELSSELYAALLKQVKITGKTETELVVQGLHQVLDKVDVKDLEQERFTYLEAALEQKLRKYVESLVSDRIAELTSQALKPNTVSNVSASEQQSFERVMPIPTIRPLQVGDRVLVLEPDSPYYMAKLLIIKTSLIRATVKTDTGEKTFLKRDLRFLEAPSE